MEKRPSIIDALHAVEAVQKNEDCRPHVVAGIDCCEHGHPHAGLLITQGTPAVVLGMIESLMVDLKTAKKKILKDMSLYKVADSKPPVPIPQAVQDKIDKTKNEVDKIISRLPPHIAEKIKIFQKKMDEAIEKGDIKELEKMRDSMVDAKSFDDVVKKILPPEKEDDSFDINEFKGD